MSLESNDFDWASAVLSIKTCNSLDLNELADAGNLSPESGDLADIDLSDLDLRGQDFTGWDLRFASFKGALIAGAKFTGAQLDISSIIEAQDWENADLPMHIRSDAQFRQACLVTTDNLSLTKHMKEKLIAHGLNTVGDIIKNSVQQISRFLSPEESALLTEALSKIGFVNETYEVDNMDETPTQDKTNKLYGNKYLYEVDYKTEPNPYHRISFTIEDELIPDDVDITPGEEVQEYMEMDHNTQES